MYPSYPALEVPTGGKEKDTGVSEPLRMRRALTPSEERLPGVQVHPFAWTAPASIQIASPRSYTWPAATSILGNCLV